MKQIVSLDVSVSTQRGGRAENQDNCRMGSGLPYLPPNTALFSEERELLVGAEGELFAVADGCGTLGALASYLVLEAVEQVLTAQSVAPAPRGDVQADRKLLLRCMERANDSLLEHNEKLFLAVKGGRRAAATLTLLLIRPDGTFTAAGVGDSPLLLLRGKSAGVTMPLDNAFAEAAGGEGGFCDPAGKYDLTRCVGMTEEEIGLCCECPPDGRPRFRDIVHVKSGALQEADRLLLLTDGVANAIPGAELPAALAKDGLDGLVRRAAGEPGRKRLFGRPPATDNCTAMLIRTHWEEKRGELADDEELCFRAGCKEDGEPGLPGVAPGQLSDARRVQRCVVYL